MRHRLEVHVVLLTLAHVDSHVAKDAKDTLHVLGINTQQVLVGNDKHRVARQDSYITTPLSIYRRLASAHRGVVHDVVVKECEVVEHLDS